MLACAAVAALAFLPILGAGFLYDDHELITRNPQIGSVGFLRDVLLQPFWEVISPLRNAAGFYRPLGGWLLAGCHHLFGDWAGGYHLISLLLHAACAAAVARLALTVGLALPAAVAAGMLFAVHGAHVEAVAWISAAPDLLATLLALLGLDAVLRHRTRAGAGWLLAAMLAKEAALGAWLLALAWVVLWPVSGLPRLRRAAPLLIAGGLLWLLRVQAFDSWAAGFDRVNTEHYFGRLDEFALSFGLLARYLAFLIWPWPHAPFQPLRVDLSWSDAERLAPALLGVAAVLVGLLGWLRSRGRSPASFLALGLLFAALAPVLNTRALGQHPFEERFLYLPSAGFALLTGAAFAWFAARLRQPRLVPAAAVLLCLPHAASLWPAQRPWLDEERFFAWARAASPHAMTPHLGFARMQLEKAQAAPDAVERQKWADLALEAYQRSLEVDVNVWFVSAIEREMGNLGLADSLFVAGDVRAAREAYEQIVGHYRNSAIGHLGLGNCAGWMAIEAGGGGDEAAFRRLWTEALGHYERALALDPGVLPAVSGMAKALGSLGRFAEAQPHAERCFAQDPANFDYATSLATIQFEQGRTTFAARTLRAFLAAAPAHPRRAEVEATLLALDQMRGQPPPQSPAQTPPAGSAPR